MNIDCSKIDDIFSGLDTTHAPGAAIGIAVAGAPVYRKAFGLASVELPVALSPSMRMRIGSTSKHFTAFAFMLLCEEGLADVDGRLGDYLPNLHAVARQVTMRQLMTNTSGLRDAFDIIWQFSGEGGPISSAEVTALYQYISDSNFPAGTSWAYNNGGFALVSAAIERITGKSLETVLAERVFRPLRMYDTALRRTDTDFVPNSATLHPLDEAGNYVKASARTEISGEGGIVSTVDDMLRWLANMGNPHIGSKETWDMITSPHVLPHGRSSGYGFGLVNGSYRGVGVVYHAGSVTGGNAQMLRVPSQGLDIVVLLNRRDVWGSILAEQILDVCLDGLVVPAFSSDRLVPAGAYISKATGRVVVVKGAPDATEAWAAGASAIVSVDGCDVTMTESGPGTLTTCGMYAFMPLSICSRTEPDGISAIELTNCGEVEIFEAAPSAVNGKAEIEGRYSADSAGVSAQIILRDDAYRFVTKGAFGFAEYSLTELAGDVWEAKSVSQIPWGGTLLMNSQSQGFWYSSAARTIALPFTRIA